MFFSFAFRESFLVKAKMQPPGNVFGVTGCGSASYKDLIKGEESDVGMASRVCRFTCFAIAMDFCHSPQSFDSCGQPLSSSRFLASSNW